MANKPSQQVVTGLSQLLADTYVLYIKTQNFHWNVMGPHFFAYHKAFEAQYEELSAAIDMLAERIRALQAPAPASMTQFLKLTSLEESDDNITAEAMIEELLADHEFVAKNIQKFFTIVQNAKDEVTLDILIQRKTEHDKTAWMLRSTIGME